MAGRQGEEPCGALLRRLSTLRAARAPLPASLTAAALAGDLESMQAFLNSGADLAEATVGFASPLTAACAAGKVAAVRLLLDRGATLAPEGAVVTPLHAAISNGHLDVFAELTARGARIEDAVTGLLAAC